VVSRAAIQPLLSVVIPTRDRPDTLAAVVRALGPFVASGKIEGIVVDDGSDGEAARRLDQMAAPSGIRILRQEHRGPAAARNLGIRAARASWVALIGDDTVPEPGWGGEILRCAADDPAGLDTNGWVGHVRWHPRLRVSPFMSWIHGNGLQFGFGLIDDPDDLPFNFLYTSNVLLPRHLLEQEPFDEGFLFAAYEDTELGYRLQDRGLRLRYLPGAVVAHDHPTTFTSFAARQRLAGASAVHFRRLHPELHWFVRLPAEGPPPSSPPTRVAALTVVARALEPLPVKLPRLWTATLDGHFARGAADAYRLADHFGFEED